jgi:ABC-type Fe3+-siderophore transport system permease subunit
MAAPIGLGGLVVPHVARMITGAEASETGRFTDS